jgi:hypothetical protein
MAKSDFCVAKSVLFGGAVGYFNGKVVSNNEFATQKPTSPHKYVILEAKSDFLVAESADLSDFAFFISDSATVFFRFFGEVGFPTGEVGRII